MTAPSEERLMARVFQFKNREGRTPLTDKELMLLAVFRQAPRKVQLRILEAVKPKKPEPGRS